MGDINKMIQWFKAKEGKVTYSQGNRLGPNSYDCSSAVYFSLIAGGFIPAGSMGWTGSLHDLTLPSIARKIARSECQKGDIFISKYWANDGHTGVFLDNNTIIHCSSGKNGIYSTSANGGWMGPTPTEYYRLNNVSESENNQSNNKGEITMQCIYTKPRQGNEKEGDMFYFNGIDTIYIAHADTAAVLQTIYRDNNGKDMPTYNWTDPTAPWFVRLEHIAPNRK